MSCDLVAIFDENVGVGISDPVHSLHPDPIKISSSSYKSNGDGDAYAQRKKMKNKPLPPSQQVIVEYYKGDKSPVKIIQTFFARSVLIGSALALFGDNKNQKSMVTNALVASASIEAFLLYWYKIKHK